MTRRFHIAAILLIGLVPALTHGQQFTQTGPLTKLGTPVALDTTGMFQASFVRAGDDLFVGGQPTERALRALKAQGVTTVVNLRSPEEMARIGFDEPAVVAKLGMKYVFLPVRGNEEFPFSPETVTRFSEAVRQANGKVLLHCTIAWRASHLLAAYLIRERAVPVDSALAYTRAINLMDGHRMNPNGKQPVEEFLGRTLPALAHPGPNDH